jgi:hypothetical protein
MPQNAYTDDLPLELQMDLLVDGELPEPRRRALLASLDDQPGQWRTVALRFLQHQTEKQTVAALMAGGTLVPAVDAAPVAAARRPIIGRIGWRRLSAAAAGLFIAATSAFLTMMVVRPAGPAVAQGISGEYQTTLPADVVASDQSVRVSVPVVQSDDNAPLFPVSVSDNPGPARTTILVQPNGKDSYVLIPVNTSYTVVY